MKFFVGVLIRTRSLIDEGWHLNSESRQNTSPKPTEIEKNAIILHISGVRVGDVVVVVVVEVVEVVYVSSLVTLKLRDLHPPP